MELKCQNVFQQIRRREYGLKQGPRSKIEILKTLILDENYVYKEVWRTYSSKHVKTEGGRIYMENYKDCYGGYGRGNKPVHLYTLHTPQDQKIETALDASIQPETLSLPNNGERPSFYCIVGKSWLIRYDLLKGHLLEKVFLSQQSYCSFKDLSWNEPGKSIVVKSTHNVAGSLRPEESRQPNIVSIFAMFEVFPLKFVGMFEVTRSVFGKDTVDAMVSSGFLTTMHRSGMVKLHSLEHIIQQCKQFEADLYTLIPDQGELCGKLPYGLPLNIVIKEEPPVLLQVRCYQNSLEVGGCPWHYIFTPQKMRGTFHVKSLSNGQLVKNGILESKAMGLEEDKALFCADESGRILHIDSSSVSMHQLKKSESFHSELEKCFTIDLRGEEDRAPPTPSVTTTASGRHVRRISLGSMLQMDIELPNLYIHNVDYENELNLLWTNVDYSILEDKMESYVRFHDISSGETVKKIKLEQPFQESMHEESDLQVDLDTLVQTVRSFNSEFACIVYRLQSKEEEKHLQTDYDGQTVGQVRSANKRNSRQSSSSRSRRTQEPSNGGNEEIIVSNNNSCLHQSRRRVSGSTNEVTTNVRRRNSRQDSDEEWTLGSVGRSARERGVPDSCSPSPRRSGRRKTKE
uniref:DDB1- and CUL4-associated factor 17-like isoform X1 n=2 Tax=Crassostrea virginica TaxID=6565 RepID=A0A8B8EMH3_CRAVI|nr:DDB1- and CUL4-associated factor 17-like isoform X1 [Crassostrea virginica]